MGYLDNSIITVDAILTKKGRELLARGDGSFKITQFALSDDEIDYTLYNPTHPSGSALYGEAIENLPLLEAFPDETQVLKYKLVTLPRGTSKLPVLDLGFASISLKQGASLAIIRKKKILNSMANSSKIISVSSPEEYLISSAARAIERFKGIVIGVTGSNGKTTTKNLIERINYSRS